MSQEKNIKSKYQKKLDVLADDIKVQQREISGLTQELESCITERNRAIQERNEALGKLSQYADENDKSVKTFVVYKYLLTCYIYVH